MSKETYHVAAILDKYHVVIAAGFNYSLSIGTKIEIFEEGEEIFDPISEVSLGHINLVKEKLEIVQVDQKYSICKKIIETERTIPGALSAISSLSKMGDQKVIDRKTYAINVNEDQILNASISLSDEEKKISVGDKARIPY